MDQEKQNNIAVLHYLLTDKHSALDFVSKYDSRIFHKDYLPVVKKIISFISQYKKPPKKDSLLKKSANNQPLIDLINTTYEEAESYVPSIDYEITVENLLEDFKKKQYDKISKLNPRDDSYLKQVNDSLNIINEACKSSTHKRSDASEQFKTFLEIVIDKVNNPKTFELSKIKTGLQTIDICTNGGLSRSADMMIIMGETGTGKSIYLNTIAINMWLGENKISGNIDNNTCLIDFNKEPIGKGENVVFYSLEMPMDNYYTRFMSSLSGIDYFKLESGKLNREEYELLKKIGLWIKRYPYKFEIVDYPLLSSIEMDASISEIKSKYSPDVIVVDYLGIMEDSKATSSDNDWLKLNNIAQQFREVIRKYNIPAITAMQVNSTGSSKDLEATIGLHRMSRSKLVATHATTIIQLVFRGEGKEENFLDGEYVLLKNRNGMKKKGSVIKQFSGGRVVDNIDIMVTIDSI